MAQTLMQDVDFEGLVSYVLEVCSEAVAAGERITPMAIVARMKEDHTPDAVGYVDLSKYLDAPNERISEMVLELASRPQYDLCCYVAQGLLADTKLEKGESIPEARQRVLAMGRPEEGQQVVMTLVYSKDREGVAFHKKDEATRTLERGVLEFPPASHGLSMGGIFSQTHH
jgi:hypothetical protein